MSMNVMLRRYLPPCPKLVKSFKLRSKEYLRENTLHGFPYFVNPARPIWERFLWLIATIAALVGALIIIVTIWQRFQTSPALVGIALETEDIEIEYPSVHLCMSSDYLNFTDIPESLAITYKTYYNWNWNTLNISNEKLPEAISNMFLQITPDCDDLLASCYNRSRPVECTHLFKKVLTSAGVCCKSQTMTLSGKGEYRNPGLKFELQHDKLLNVYLQATYDDPPLRGGPIGYHLRQNTKMEISFAVTEAAEGLRLLSRSQRECVFHDEAPSYNNCVLQCLRDVTSKMCGCLPWFLSINSDDQCALDEYSCLVKYKDELYNAKCKSKCYIFCHHTSSEFRFVKADNVTSIPSLWPTYSFKREIRFGWLDLVVSFGGIMGVFLGYSMLTTIELFYYFSLRFYCGAILDDRDNNNMEYMRKIRVIEKREKKKEEKTIGQWYYDYVN